MKISNLVKIHTKEIPIDTIIFSRKSREKWCQMPYPGHRKGCPNYNKSPLCPPQALFRGDILMKYDQFILVYGIFDFGEYRRKMKEIKNHHEWTDRQCRNVLYWQGQLKKILKDYIKDHFYEGKEPTFDEMFGAGSGFKFYDKNSGKKIEAPSLEAVGINVFSTLKRNNISYEIKPQDRVVMITLLMSKLSK